MTLLGANEKYLSAHRVVLLVQGTTPSVLTSLGDSGQPLAAQAFRVSSKNVKCLLSDEEVFVHLYGYCDMDAMLQYRLDKETALVYASAVDVDGSEKTFTVEHMEKVQDSGALRASLEAEWQTALLESPPAEKEKQASPLKAEYWDRDVKRLKRMISEPTA